MSSLAEVRWHTEDKSWLLVIYTDGTRFATQAWDESFVFRWVRASGMPIGDFQQEDAISAPDEIAS